MNRRFIPFERPLNLMNHNGIYDIVCIGNYTRDTITTPSGRTNVDGGAINYAAHAVARLGLKVAVVTRLSEEDKRVVDAFVQAGIDCFPTYTPSSTCMHLEYPTTNPDLRNLSVTETAGSVTPAEVDGLNMKSAIIGSSLRGEVGLDVIERLRQKQVLLALDVQGFVRVLRGRELKYEPWGEMQETLACVDILKSDAVEAEYLTGETDIYKAARAFAHMGPKEIVLTHKDGLLIHAEDQFHNLQFHSKQLSGRSGRGDTCAGTYTGMRLSKSPKEAGIWAAAVTSLKMEKQGTFNRSIHEVEDLIHSKYNGAVHA
jgi:sugar/nucleoside kinase (ribokinase family)